MEPLVEFIVPNKPKLSFAKVTVDKVPALLDQVVNLNLDAEKPFYRVDEQDNPLSGEKTPYVKGRLSKAFHSISLMEEIPFYKKQIKIATRNCGVINPGSLEEYIARGGYFALYKAMTEMTPDQIIEDVIASGLRGSRWRRVPYGVEMAFLPGCQGKPQVRDLQRRRRRSGGLTWTGASWRAILTA